MVVVVVPRVRAIGPLNMAAAVFAMEAGRLPMTISLKEARRPHYCERGLNRGRITDLASTKPVLRGCIIFVLHVRLNARK